MKTTSALLFLAFAATTASAQQPNVCPTYASIPGGSSGRDALSRCSLSNAPTLRSTVEKMLEPIYARRVTSDLTIVVDSDGTVVEEFTRYWSVSAPAGPFHDQLRGQILNLEFERGILDGQPRRYGFRLHVTTEVRQDEAPSRIEWSYRSGGTEGDTLHGRWVPTDAPPPLEPASRASAVRSVLGELARMNVLLTESRETYCLIYRGPEQEVIERVVYDELGYPGVTSQRGGGEEGCAADFQSLRLKLSDFVLAGGERMVVEVAGDLLAAWPPGFDARPSRAWNAGCVVPRTTQTTEPTLCNVWPIATDIPEMRYGEPDLLPARLDSDPVALAFSARLSSSGAFAIDTLRGHVERVPALTESARFVRSPTICAGSIPHLAEGPPSSEGAFIAWLRPDVDQGAAEIDLVEVRRLRPHRAAAPCDKPAVARRPWFLFALGGVGTPLSDTVTFCAHRPLCGRRHEIVPGAHEPLAEPHLRFTTADLSERARGGGFLTVRLNVDRDASGLVPFIVRRTGHRPQAFALLRTAPGQFDLSINFGDEQWVDAEYLIYFVSVGAPELW